LVVSLALLKLFPLDVEKIIVRHFNVEGDARKKWRGSFIVLQLYKLEHLVSNDYIPVVPECNLDLRCLMVFSF
jgi:hypothetical protein